MQYTPQRDVQRTTRCSETSRYYRRQNDKNHLMVVSFLKAELYLSEKCMGVWQVWRREEKERDTYGVLCPSCRRYGVFQWYCLVMRTILFTWKRHVRRLANQSGHLHILASPKTLLHHGMCRALSVLSVHPPHSTRPCPPDPSLVNKLSDGRVRPRHYTSWRYGCRSTAYVR